MNKKAGMTRFWDKLQKDPVKRAKYFAKRGSTRRTNIKLTKKHMQIPDQKLWYKNMRTLINFANTLDKKRHYNQIHKNARFNRRKLSPTHVQHLFNFLSTFYHKETLFEFLWIGFVERDYLKLAHIIKKIAKEYGEKYTQEMTKLNDR